MKYVWALDITNLAVDERIAEDDPLIPLKNLDAPRYSVSPVAYRASLQEAVATLRTTSVDALYVIAPSHFGWPDIMGIVTRGDIEERYLKLD
jgi:poly-D-alanine transfer protein DltD